jgi:bifunctional non-homologous end joining protein LigD
VLLPPLPSIKPLRLSRVSAPFDDPDWIFEIKHDGFRALAFCDNGEVRLVSRNGNVFKSFPSLVGDLGAVLRRQRAVLDGEIVCLDSKGRSEFNDLLYRRGEPYFYAFDLIWCDGRDLQRVPLHDRKVKLRTLIPATKSRLLFCDHVEDRGCDLYSLAYQHDLEGIVAKHKSGLYICDETNTSWFKIRNQHYSQIVGREERFERLERPHEPEQAGWASCVLACAATNNQVSTAERQTSITTTRVQMM